MFYVLQEDRKFLLDLWDDIINNESIDPYSELNIDLIENYNKFIMPDSDIPLVFIDDEYGFCGCAVLTPLETNDQQSNILKHNARWVLHTVNLYFNKPSPILFHPKVIHNFKEKFYFCLRGALLELLQSEYNKSIMVISENWESHEDMLSYAHFVLRDLPYKTESGIIGLISDIRDYQQDTSPKQKQENPKVVYFKKKAI